MDKKRHQAFLETIRSQIIPEKHTGSTKTVGSSDEIEKYAQSLEENFKKLFGTSTEA